MSLRRTILLGAGLLLAAGSAAFAAHGRAGLWNIATTMDMSGAMPPKVVAQMKAMGMAMATQTFNSQICMTQAEVDADKPPASTDAQSGCTSRLTSQSASAMTAQMTCNGRMKGTGTMTVSYGGTDHYNGKYDFQGTVEGRPAKMSSSFKGDWVKADCGAIKPGARRIQPYGPPGR